MEVFASEVRGRVRIRFWWRGWEELSVRVGKRGSCWMGILRGFDGRNE